MATLARNRFPSGLGWFILLALLLLAWCQSMSSCGTRKKSVHRVSSIQETATSIRKVETSIINNQVRSGSINIKDSQGQVAGKIYPKGQVSYDPQKGFTGEADSIVFYGNFRAQETNQDSTMQNYSENKTSDLAAHNEARKENKEVQKDKQSDTTWSANFPPWLILTIAALIIVAIWLWFWVKR